jgi:hypothetical protein
MSGVETALLIMGSVAATIIFMLLVLVFLSEHFIKINERVPDKTIAKAKKNSHVTKKGILKVETTYID